MYDLVYVACELTKGGFSGELIFTIARGPQEIYKGIAPRQYCRDNQGMKIHENHQIVKSPTQLTVLGRVAARVVARDLTHKTISINFPDGETEVFRQQHLVIYPRVSTEDLGSLAKLFHRLQEMDAHCNTDPNEVTLTFKDSKDAQDCFECFTDLIQLFPAEDTTVHLTEDSAAGSGPIHKNLQFLRPYHTKAPGKGKL